MSGEIELEESNFRNPSDRKYEDIEAGEMATCRICLESEVEKDDALISPCMCKGTMQFVHRGCLDHWRSVKEGFAFSHCTICKVQFHLKVVKLKGISRPKIKFALLVTRDFFRVFLAVQTMIGLIGGLTFTIDKYGSFKIYFNAIGDHIRSTHPLLFYYCTGVISFFTMIGFVALIFQCMTCNNDSHTAGCQNFSLGCGILGCFSVSTKIYIPLVIILFVIVILGFSCGILGTIFAAQRIWQKHSHILTKKELTKEYVVEDLHGCYTPSKLAQEYVDHLRMLKLM